MEQYWHLAANHQTHEVVFNLLLEDRLSLLHQLYQDDISAPSPGKTLPQFSICPHLHPRVAGVACLQLLERKFQELLFAEVAHVQGIVQFATTAGLPWCFTPHLHPTSPESQPEPCLPSHFSPLFMAEQQEKAEILPGKGAGWILYFPQGLFPLLPYQPAGPHASCAPC